MDKTSTQSLEMPYFKSFYYKINWNDRTNLLIYFQFLNLFWNAEDYDGDTSLYILTEFAFVRTIRWIIAAY